MIKMKGSDTEVNLAVNLAEKFAEENPNFSIAISNDDLGLRIPSLLNGQADMPILQGLFLKTKNVFSAEKYST